MKIGPDGYLTFETYEEWARLPQDLRYEWALQNLDEFKRLAEEAKKPKIRRP